MPKSLTDLQVFNNIEAESTVTANTIALKTDNSTAPSYGQIAWNAVERTFDIGMGNGVVGQALREMHYPPVINNTGVTIPNGTPVGAVGYDVTNQKIEIAPFIADGTYPSYLFLGLTTEEIANGAVGLVTHFGNINNIDTSSFTPFSTVYVSDTVAGQLVSVAPISPSQKIGIGVVTVSNASLGSIFVRPIVYPEAVDVRTDTSQFNAILSGADSSVQTALQTLSNRALDKNVFNTAGDILYATGDNTYTVLPKGTDGQVLKLSSGLPSWGTDNNTTYSVGNGLTSAGTVFSMGTPSGLSATTTDATTSTSHTHSIATASAVALSNASTNTAGTSVSLARADHTHAITGFSLDTHNHTGVYQPLDADLTSIAGLTGTTGFLKKTAANTWSLDTNSYLNLTGGTLTGTLTSRAITPSANNTYDIGTSSVKYKNGYFAGTLTADGGATIGGTLSVNNLTVNGTTTTINSTTVTIDDPIFTLGGDTAPTLDDSKDRGIEYRWHNGTTAKIGFFGYDDSTGYFTFIPDADNDKEVFSGAKGTLDANLNGNASTVTNGVYTTGSYSDPSWLSISKTKVGLSNVENTKLSTWAGTSNITTVGTLSSGTIPWSLISGKPSTYAPSAHTLDNHSNVTITSNSSGEILKWDGTAWVNNTLVEAGIQPAGSYLTTATGFGGDVYGTYNAIVVANDSHTHTASTLPSTMPPSSHALSSHTASGLTTGHFLKATGATTYGFVAHGLTYTDVGALASNHAASGVTTTKIGNWDAAYTHSTSTHYAEPGIFSGGGTPTLATGVTAAKIRTLIGAGTSSTTGTVTSVGLSVPTGLSISGSPVTTSGTLAISLATGYSIPTTAKQTQWDSAYTHSTSTHAPTNAQANQTITAGNGMNFTATSGNVTITMGKPSTLSASTSDGLTSSSHTHAITATNSGAASTLVKTGSDGSVTATDTFNFGSNASMVYNSTSKTIDFVFV